MLAAQNEKLRAEVARSSAHMEAAEAERMLAEQRDALSREREVCVRGGVCALGHPTDEHLCV